VLWCCVVLCCVVLCCVVLCNVSEHITWSASTVYKDGTQENVIGLILDSVTWERKRRRKYRRKILYLRSGKLVIKNIARNCVLLFWREGDKGYLLKWGLALLGCYAALIVTDVSGHSLTHL
jgi:hypothetical protein